MKRFLISFPKKAFKVILAIVIALSVITFQGAAVVPVSAEDEPLAAYFDTSLTFAERATDLVSRMTNAEKVAQLNTSAIAIPRLSVPAYNWWQESIRGPRNVRALSFPTGVSLSMSWDDDLMYRQASIIGDECRTYYRQSRRPLSQFNPTINLLRDPRWGRNEEGFGEDPYMVGRLGTEYVLGIQGGKDVGSGFMSPSGEKYMKTIATPKHYAANNSEFDRYVGDSQMDERELREYYTYHFREVALNASPGSLMTAYNRVNSVPMFAHTYLNNTLLRKMWGFTGYIVSDCDGIANIVNDHKWNPRNSYPESAQNAVVNNAQAAAYAMMGGTDLSCNWTQTPANGGGFYGTAAGGGNIATAVSQGVVTDNGIMSWDDVDRALVRMFTQRMATGEFDTTAPGTNLDIGGTYGTYTQATHLETAANTDVSLEASRKGVVLLRNEDNILPLKPEKFSTVAVVSKMLDRVELGDSNYASNPTRRVSFRQGITDALQNKGFNTSAANLKFYTAGAGSTVSGNLFNARNMRINGTTINTITANTLNGCSVENNSNLAYIQDGSYAIFNSIPISNGEIKSFEIEVATNGTGSNWNPVVELRLDSPTGQLITKLTAAKTSAWQTYSWNSSADLSHIVHTENARLCLVFTTSISQPATGFTEALLNEIAESDVVIYYGGTAKDPSSMDVARENRDRLDMNFPADQASEIRQIIDRHDNVILAIQAVGMLNITEFANNPDPAKNAKAILFQTFNGQFQGQAVSEILTGITNPTARLSFTWYADESKMPPMPSYNGSNQRNNPVNVDYSIRPRTNTPWGRTYQYYTGPVLYPFGYGLSYSTYTYANPTISKSTVTTAEKFYVEVDVTNSSNVNGAEVVQVYMVPPGAGTDTGNGIMPFKQLKGFTRVEIPAGQTKKVRVELNTDEWWFIDKDGKRVVSEGVYGLQIGRSTEEIKHTFNVTISGKVAPWLQNITLMGDKIKVTPSQPVNTSLFIAMSDETFLQASQATVVYSSNRPNVAAVDQTGKITAKGDGTAVITATVTYGGKIMEADYSIISEIDTSMESFTYGGETFTVNDGETEIDVNVPKSTSEIIFPASAITPIVPDAVDVNVALTPSNGAVATGEPCKATITITAKTNPQNTKTYTVWFGYLTAENIIPIVSADGWSASANIRFSDGGAAKLIFAIYESGKMTYFSQSLNNSIAKHKSGVISGSGSVGAEFDARGYKVFVWDQNFVPIAPSFDGSKYEVVEVWKKVPDAASVAAGKDYVIVSASNATLNRAMVNSSVTISSVVGLNYTQLQTTIYNDNEYLDSAVPANAIWTTSTGSTAGTLRFRNSAASGLVTSTGYLGRTTTGSGATATAVALGNSTTANNVNWRLTTTTGGSIAMENSNNATLYNYYMYVTNTSGFRGYYNGTAATSAANLNNNAPLKFYEKVIEIRPVS